MSMLPQPLEGAAGFDQLLIGAALDYLPLIQDDNLVDLVEAVEVVRDEQGGMTRGGRQQVSGEGTGSPDPGGQRARRG
jgi:hypothetical protein